MKKFSNRMNNLNNRTQGWFYPILLFVCFAIIIWAIFFRPRSTVINMYTSENFEGSEDELQLFQSARNSTSPIFALLYAPWCGHCTKIKPFWQEIMDIYKNNDKVKVVKVDVDTKEEGKHIGQEYGVKGYPTILWIDGDKVDEYQGDRSKSGLLQYIQSKL